ncbi:MAG: MiaB/RimO family radical SAM methylthiotransferase [Planctomycetota bacterium]
MSRVRFVTYGCKANQYDTQVLREALLRRGWSEGADPGAELCVVNTCTVTAEAGRKARQLVRRIHRESPETKICVTGCLAESEPEILRELPGVSWVLGNGEAKRPVNFLRELGHEVDPEELGVPSGITEFSGHTRAFLKIQDGCDMACAFCIIPHVRGKSTSRPAAELAAEVRRLLDSGHVEIVLCGIHIGHWGRDLDLGLEDLLTALVAVEPPLGPNGEPVEWRLRLSSIEATEVTDPVLDVMSAHPKRIAAHLHMPMQSGSDEVLRSMNRWYDVAEYLEACDRVRSALDRPAFTADVLVGFPGEEEHHFVETLASVRQAGFSRIHVFPFSARPGTRAAELGPPPPPEAVRDRRARLSELAAELGRDFALSLDGMKETVVLEGSAGLCGRYQRVKVSSSLLPVRGAPPATVDVRLRATQVEAKEEGIATYRSKKVELHGEALEALEPSA